MNCLRTDSNVIGKFADIAKRVPQKQRVVNRINLVIRLDDWPRRRPFPSPSTIGNKLMRAEFAGRKSEPAINRRG